MSVRFQLLVSVALGSQPGALLFQDQADPPRRRRSLCQPAVEFSSGDENVPYARNTIEFSALNESANGDDGETTQIGGGFRRLKGGGLNVKFQLPRRSGFVRARTRITLRTVSFHSDDMLTHPLRVNINRYAILKNLTLPGSISSSVISAAMRSL